MIDLKSLPCLREHFEKVADQETAAGDEPAVEYARAPDGPGFQPTGRPAATQRNLR